MITVDMITDRIVHITVPETLKANDFEELSPKVDIIIKEHGKACLLVDARNFHGWEDMEAFEKHIGFVKSHHEQIHRIAAIVGPEWMQWVLGTLKIFVHPEVRIFDEDEHEYAERWIKES